MKVYYYNDEKHGVALAVNDLHYTRLVPPQAGILVDIDISESQSLYIKKWDKMVLISTINLERLPETEVWRQDGKSE
jgi:hypothetical protein